MSFMKKIQAASFKSAKQLAMQKMGKAEKTEEVPEFQALLDHLENTHKQIKRLYKYADSYVSKSKAALEAGEKLNKALKGEVVDPKEGIEDKNLIRDTPVKNNLMMVGTANEEVSHHLVKLNESANQWIVNPFKALLDNEVEKALDAKIQYQKSLLEHDATKVDLEKARKKGDQAKIAKLEQDLQQATTKYEEAKKTLEEKILEMDEKMNTDLVEKLNQYMSAQIQVFKDSAEIMAREQYRKYSVENISESESKSSYSMSSAPPDSSMMGSGAAIKVASGSESSGTGMSSNMGSSPPSDMNSDGMP